MSNLVQDIRFGCRMMLKYPVLSVIAILTLGVGIGIITFVFSIVNGIFFRGIPFPEGERVVRLAFATPSIWKLEVRAQDYATLRERQTVFESIGAWSAEPVNLAASDAAPLRVSAAYTTVGVLESLRVPAVLGRIFRDGEDRPGAEPVVILGYETWRDCFGKSPDVLGSAVRANGVSRTVVGIMPEGFAFPDRQQLWIPLEVESPASGGRGRGYYSVLGRLRRGVSVRQANAQVAAIAAQLAREFPETNAELTAWVKPFPESVLAPPIYGLMATMFAAGIGVLLIACVNVANLVLARSSLRVREVAVRMALGAGRWRIVEQLIAEIAIVAAIGGIIGLGLAHSAVNWFRQALTAEPPPFFMKFDIDYRVMGFVLAAVAASTLFAGLFPALRATGKHAGNALKDESRGATGLRIGRFSGALIVAEVAASCGLLIAAGLMIRSIVRLSTAPMPFDTDTVLTGKIYLPEAKYGDGAGRIRFFERLLPRLESIPGVQAATLSDRVPAAGSNRLPVQIEGRSDAAGNEQRLFESVVMPGYFKALRVQLMRGRDFTASDRAGSMSVAIVNDSFAKQQFNGLDPVGRRIRLGRDGPAGAWRTIVGVVPDLLMQGMDANNRSGAGYYIPIAQSGMENQVAIAVRTRGEPAAVTPAVRAAVAEIDPDLAVYDVFPMRELIARMTWFYRVFGSLFMVFGCVALLLAVAGLYGVMSFSVTQRRREMAIRAALGAQTSALVMLLMRRGVVRLALGLAIGLAVGMAATGPLSPILYHVDTRDPLVLGLVPAALAAAGLLASFFPALRVSRIRAQNLNEA